MEFDGGVLNVITTVAEIFACGLREFNFPLHNPLFTMRSVEGSFSVLTKIPGGFTP
jgi:hypothetical protein